MGQRIGYAAALGALLVGGLLAALRDASPEGTEPAFESSGPPPAAPDGAGPTRVRRSTAASPLPRPAARRDPFASRQPAGDRTPIAASVESIVPDADDRPAPPPSPGPGLPPGPEAVEPAGPPRPPDLVVEMVCRVGGQMVVVVSGRTLRAGDSYRGATIDSVTAGRVVLTGEFGLVSLRAGDRIAGGQVVER